MEKTPLPEPVPHFPIEDSEYPDVQSHDEYPSVERTSRIDSFIKRFLPAIFIQYGPTLDQLF